MPQLDILIWFSLCIGTTILFWIVYYIVLRFLIINNFFTFDIRIKLRNLFFVLSYVLFSLVFKSNYRQIFLSLLDNNATIRNINIYIHFYIKCVNKLYTLQITYIFNNILLKIQSGYILHNYLYNEFLKRI